MKSMICAGFFALATLANEFTLVRKEKGIALYERWIEHGKEQVREIKAVLIVNATIDAITSLLANPQLGTQWNAHAKNYQVVPLVAQQKWVTYIRYSIPWPFNDQDCCLQYSVSRSSPKHPHAEVSFQSIGHEKFPIQPGTTRLTGTNGKWLLDSLKNGSTLVTYTITTDRSVKVPRWVSDPIIRNNLFETMTAFRKLLEK